jgi:hypothetical protein
MNEMLKRMCLAMARIEGERGGEASDFADWHWEEYEDQARAALSAMRAPTSAMRAAGRRVREDQGGGTSRIWRAMIDEAAR